MADAHEFGGDPVGGFGVELKKQRAQDGIKGVEQGHCGVHTADGGGVQALRKELMNGAFCGKEWTFSISFPLNHVCFQSSLCPP
jgi:hypothetical protein